MAGSSKIMETVIAIAGEISPTLGKAISGVNKQLGGLSDVTLIATASIAAVGSAAIKAGEYLLDLGSSFDAATDAIRIGTGATGDALDALMEDFDTVYSNVPTTMEDASKAIADYNTRLGLTGPVLQDISKQAIQVSDMLGDDLNSVIETSSQAFQQWSVDSGDMGDAMDYIFKVSQSTGMGFTKLMEDMQKFGPQLQEMGYSFEEASALIGQLEKAGVNTEEVLGAMKKSVGELAKDGIDASVGLEVFCEYIQEAETAADAAAIAADVFGTRAGSTMAAAIRNGTLSVADLTASLMASDETIAGAASDTYDFAEKLQMMKQKAEVALQPAANTIFDSLNKVMPIAEELMAELTPIIEDAAAAAASFIEGAADDIAEWISNLIPKIIDAVKWIRNNMGLIKGIATAIGIVAAALGVLNTVLAIQSAIMAANPVTWIVLGIIAAIAALIAIIVLCVKHWDEIRAAAMSAVEWIVGAWSSVATWINENVVQPIAGFFSNLWAGIDDGIDGMIEFFTSAFQSLAGIVKSPINAVISIINGAIDGINSIGFDIPEWVPVIGGQKFKLDIPKLPALATGGLTNGLSIAGEDPRYPNEWVLSLNPAYREENLSYWAKAGRMLGADASDFDLGNNSGASIYLGGVTFAPNITITGRADKGTIMEAIEEEYPEFIDMLDEYLMSRGVTVYA